MNSEIIDVTKIHRDVVTYVYFNFTQACQTYIAATERRIFGGSQVTIK